MQILQVVFEFTHEVLRDLKVEFTSKEAGVQALKIYLLNLLNEPQHLAEIKAPKLLKTSKQRVTNLRERKLKNN